MSRPPEGAGPVKAVRYELRVQGVLDARWSAWFEGLQVSRDQAGQTTIAGTVADQAALHGLLTKIRDLDLPCSPSAASTKSLTRMEAAMRQLPRPTRPSRTQRSQRSQMSRRQRGRRPATPIDRRTPSGRPLAYLPRHELMRTHSRPTPGAFPVAATRPLGAGVDTVICDRRAAA